MYQNLCLMQLGLLFKQIQQLECLKISFAVNNLINFDSFQAFSDSLANQINLKQLSLTFKEGNLICSKSAKCLGQALVNLKNIQKLNFIFEKSQIGQEGFEYLQNGIKNLAKISEIKLYFTELASVYLVSLIQNLPLINSKTFQLSCLPSLYFVKNIQDHSVQSIHLRTNNEQVDAQCMLKGIKTLTDLKNLQLNLKDFLKDENSVIMFGQFLNDLTNLIQLTINLRGQNKISESGALKIGQGITNQMNLKHLLIKIDRENNLNINGATMLAKSICALKDLEILEFKINESNQFFSECLIQLSEGIKNNFFLKILKVKIMKGNTINSLAILSFANSLKDLNNLEQLNFQIDQTTELSLDCFKAFIENLKSKQKTMKELKLNINSPYKSFFISLFQEFYDLISKKQFQDQFQIKNINSINQNITELDIEFQFHNQKNLYLQGFSTSNHLVIQVKLQIVQVI
ncbi:hypothetical protein TTHERM_00571690 (macronuclear) [Tetrahymena thermophila SB210]|uniref:Kinase domain protein n=1 Tax=Tetrahymena thermophila (strain SB210) TaxID=312017 RepID=Q24I05_TETTS|nr:hypothetical protein TTHERM_00571690 [Tetrahymena thermophila SB210]EAS07433.2 hypothetical protein TTHERM_00571690 [Tetrahymena thermophila SB210]|eukprot:XP_001027675.2 hypothetical protein TTHERM_00571690 [Tetrahymena thermophila SB210]